MTSQIFQTQRHLESKPESDVRQTLLKSIAMHWLLAVLMISAVVLFPERPAWGEATAEQVNQTCIARVSPCADGMLDSIYR